jgi:hypothetical protein
MNDKHSEPASESFESYHQRNCKICRHPDRPAIEHDFLHWRSPDRIAREYDVPWRSIYRHAHAVKLYDRRRRNLRSSVELLVEGASRVEPTADGVFRAIQLYARMNDAGEIREIPKTQVIVISRDGIPPGTAGVAIPANPAPEMRFASTFPVAIQINPSSSGPIPCEPEKGAYEGRQLDNPIQTDFDVTP